MRLRPAGIPLVRRRTGNALCNRSGKPGWNCRVLVVRTECPWKRRFRDNPDNVGAHFAQPSARHPVEAGGDSIDAVFFQLDRGMPLRLRAAGPDACGSNGVVPDNIVRHAPAVPNEFSLFGTSHAGQSVV
jgi:hypothetical protein